MATSPAGADRPAGGVALPGGLRAGVDGYLAQLDRELPGTAQACYAVGSLALGDFSPRFSNIDLVVVADDQWDARQLQRAAAAEHHLHRPRQPAAVVYVSTAELRGDPHAVASARSQPTVGDRSLLTPMTWVLLRDRPLALRGPARPEVGLAAGLERWATDRLEADWSSWLAKGRRRPLSLWLKRSVADPVLEVARLTVAARGEVVSKSDAAVTLIAELSGTEGEQRVLRDALAYRDGASTSLYWGPLERKNHALRLVGHLTGRTGANRP